MEPGRFHGQGHNTGSDLDPSIHETSSSTTATTTTTRRYSMSGVIRSIFHAVVVQDTEHLDHVLNSLSLDPNTLKDREGKTMLMVAATENKHRVVRYLLTLSSLNIDLQDEEGETALYQAAAAGSTECVRLLLLAGASATIGNEESITPLIIASYNGFVTICHLLISIGRAQVNQQDNTQKSALLLASYAGHVDVMTELIEHGASLDTLDQYGWSSLMLAAYAGKLEACRLLLTHGANPHIKTANGKNARSLAWDAGHKAVAVFISKSLSRKSPPPSTSGTSSGMSSRAMIQQMLPSSPKSPSRRTHSPAPSLPSVPEEDLEEANYATQRSYTGYNSTISRQSVRSSHRSPRRPLPIVTSSPSPNTDEDEPVSPIPTALASSHLVNMFNNPNDISSLESGVYEASSVSASLAAQSIPDMVQISTPVEAPVPEPVSNDPVAEPPKKRTQASKPTASSMIHSIHRHGVIPKYGSRHLHYQLEERHDDTAETGGSTPAVSSAKNQHRFRLYQRPSGSASEREKEMDMEDSINRQLLRHQDSQEQPRNHPWVVLSKFLTMCCPIGIFPGSRKRDTRRDWREKTTLAILLMGLSIVFGFLAIGLPLLTCRPHSIHDVSITDFQTRYGNSSRTAFAGRLMAIRGSVYDVGALFSDGRHPSTAGSNLTQMSFNTFLNLHYGTDISYLFLPSQDLAATCDLTGSTTNFGKCSPAGSDNINHCHNIQALGDLLQDYSRNDVRIVYRWADIQRFSAHGRALFVYDGQVFDATDYLVQPLSDSATEAERMRMDWIRSFVGRDVSLAVQRRSDHKGIASCLHGYFRVGVLDGQPNGCVASIVINTLTLAILVLITVLRLVSALYYRRIIPKHHANAGKNSPNPAIGADTKGESHVLMLVTCCATDTEDQIKATLDSLAMTDYDDSRKMILVITDATLDTSGGLSQASLSCMRLLSSSTTGESSSEKAERGEVGVEHDTDPFALGGCQPTVSSPEADTTRVHSGHYVVDTRRVPYVLIIRPSKAHDQESPFETWHKKRLVIQWLHRVCFNEPMSAFEFNLLERVRELNHEGPGVFDMLLTTEVGSVCDQRSVGQLVSTLESNNQIMGASGHGLVANRSRNWLTRLQDYENHLYLQFRSAFESSFGAVQCLSNRFGIIRIKIKLPGAPYEGDVRFAKRPSEEVSSISAVDDEDDLEVGDKDIADSDCSKPSITRNQRDSSRTRYFVPILIHPDVVSSFVKHKTTTLHERILVLRGGEDRYLTGLLFRTFPRRRIVYRPYAIYQFPVTPNLLVYIREQRLLWISSFHNLWVQIWSSRLRGLFCWSINFLALLEWLNLVLLPMIIVMTVVLLVVVAIGAVTDEGAFYSLPTMLALAFMVSSTILQPILGIFLGRRSMVVDLVGLALFLVTLPFKSLVVSVYAFLGHDEHDSSASDTSDANDPSDTTERMSVSFPGREHTRRQWAEWNSLRRAKNPLL